MRVIYARNSQDTHVEVFLDCGDEVIMTIDEAHDFIRELQDVTNKLHYKLLSKGLRPVKDEWVPANGGTETPFNTRSGRKVLYVWNPLTGQHAHLDMGTDMILTGEEERIALGW